MKREDFYNEDRKERRYYESLTANQEVALLPVTTDGFEALLSHLLKKNDLPVDDIARSLLAGFIHHIASDVKTIDLTSAANALYKSYSNTMTFKADQDAKKRAKDEFDKEQAAKIEPKDNVLPINGSDSGL